MREEELEAVMRAIPIHMMGELAMEAFGQAKRFDASCLGGADVVRATLGGDAEDRLLRLGYNARESGLSFVTVDDSHFYVESSNGDGTTGVIGVNCRNGGPFPANLSWAVDGIERRGPDPISRRLWDRMKVAIGFPSRMP